MIKQIYSQKLIDRTAKLTLMQENLFLKKDLTKNLFPNSTLYFYPDVQILKLDNKCINAIVIDEILHICLALMPPITPEKGNGENILHSHFLFNNQKFTNMSEENYIKLKNMLMCYIDVIEIYFYPFENYKDMFNHVLRYMKDEEDLEDKFDLFFSLSV